MRRSELICQWRSQIPIEQVREERQPGMARRNHHLEDGRGENAVYFPVVKKRKKGADFSAPFESFLT
jgi:hypothetical protein